MREKNATLSFFLVQAYQMIKFPGAFTMKKLSKVVFTYEDGTSEQIEDVRAVLLFQSRCNGLGIISGMEDFIVSNNETETKCEGCK